MGGIHYIPLKIIYYIIFTLNIYLCFIKLSSKLDYKIKKLFNMDTVTVHYWPTEPQSCSSIQPLSFILTITLILSSCTTIMLCTSVWTNHWEYIEWDYQEVSLVKVNNFEKIFRVHQLF